MAVAQQNDFQIVVVNDRRSLRDFIRVPWSVYRDDPAWVPPLLTERKQALAPDQPFFKHARWQGWVAYRDRKPIGRITAQVDDLHQQRYGDHMGYFGMIEIPDDVSVATALFGTAEAWLRDQGMKRVAGPFSLGVNQEIGVLVEGFETPPFVMMGHARPYYGAVIEACGYRRVRDLLAYVLPTDISWPRTMTALQKKMRESVTVRPLDPKHKDKDLETMRDIFNDAWSENWAFVPFTQEEFRAVGHELLLITPNDFVRIAELDGEPVAFMVMLPNINEAIADLNGRLLPLGWIKLLWRLKVRFPSTTRVALMGVRRHLQKTRFGPGLAFELISTYSTPVLSRKVKRIEMSWVLEENKGVRNIIETVSGKVTKRYRMYEKEL